MIAERALQEDRLGGRQMGEPARAVLAWHLVEDLELRDVASDVMQAMSVGELLEHWNEALSRTEGLVTADAQSRKAG